MAKTALPRVLGFLDVSVLSSASMGPAYSLASTMGAMIAVAGASAPIALLLLTLVMLCVASTFARLTDAFPHAGSTYAWVRTAFGPRMGAYAGWIVLLSSFFAAIATAMPAGIYTLDLVAPGLVNSPFWEAVVGVVWIIGGALLLHLGLRPTALTTGCLLLGEFIVLGLSAGAAFLTHAPVPASPAGRPFSLTGIPGLLPAMLLAVWMVDGWELSASTSEETRQPGSTAGRAGFTALLLTSIVLFLAMSAYLRVGSVGGFSEHQADAMAYVAQQLGGGPWRAAIITTVLVSTSSALWTTLLYLSRSVYAMGRDGVLWRSLGTLDARGRSTSTLIAVTITVCGATLLNGCWPTAADALRFILNGSSVFLGLLFLGSSAAALRLAPKLRGGVGAMAVSGIGMIMLCGIIGEAFWQADGNVRLADIGLLALGLPFAQRGK